MDRGRTDAHHAWQEMLAQHPLTLREWIPIYLHLVSPLYSLALATQLIGQRFILINAIIQWIMERPLLLQSISNWPHQATIVVVVIRLLLLSLYTHSSSNQIPSTRQWPLLLLLLEHQLMSYAIIKFICWYLFNSTLIGCGALLLTPLLFI